jgi:hypothetical protein
LFFIRVVFVEKGTSRPLGIRVLELLSIDQRSVVAAEEEPAEINNVGTTRMIYSGCLFRRLAKRTNFNELSIYFIKWKVFEFFDEYLMS